MAPCVGENPEKMPCADCRQMAMDRLRWRGTIVTGHIMVIHGVGKQILICETSRSRLLAEATSNSVTFISLVCRKC